MKKVALITGSTRGIGRSIALQLAKDGYIIVVNGTNQKLIDSVVQEIKDNGNDAIGFCANVSNEASVNKMMNFVIQEYGAINVFIHNAGIVQDAKSLDMTVDQWHSVIDVHLNGAFYCISSVLPHMIASGGDIIFMTSTAGLVGSKGQLNYSAAKAGLLGMLWTLAEELKSNQIRVNAISPAALTDMTRPVIEFIRKKYEKRSEPFPDFWKVGEPDHIAQFVSAFLKNPNSNLTGEIFGVNGTTYTKWEKPVPTFTTNNLEQFFKTFEGE